MPVFYFGKNTTAKQNGQKKKERGNNWQEY